MDAMTAARTGRRVWGRLEAIHVLAYFAPPVLEATVQLGLEDPMVGYIAGRSAPMGQVGPELVTAAFYGFSPAMVARALPAAWATARPEQVLQAKQQALQELLRDLVGDADELARAAELAREVSLLQPILGRPLAAAWSSVPWGDDPALVLWQSATRIRESRGDGHVAVLVEAQLDGVEAHLAMRGDTPKLRAILGAIRGITHAEWDAAADRLRGRGVLDAEGALTAEGVALRDRLERRTDELAAPAWGAFGSDRSAALLEALDPLVARILDVGIVPRIVARIATA